MGPLIHQTESLDIVGSPTNQNRIISEFPKCGITVDAEKGANLSRLMIMVDAHSGGEHLQTESTTSILGRKTVVVLLDRDAVLPGKPGTSIRSLDVLSMGSVIGAMLCVKI